MQSYGHINAGNKRREEYQGCAGRPFIPRGGAKVKIHGAGRGEGENPRGGAKKRANQPIQKFYKSAKNIILHIIILIII